METEITPEQKEQLNTWASQRDAILLEISGLTTLRDTIQDKNKQLSESNSDIIEQSVFVSGRIEELKKKESELPLLISKEIASLSSEKTLLESQVTELKNSIIPLVEKKESLEKDIDFSIKTFEAVKTDTLSLEKIVDHVKKVSEQNKFIVEDLVETIKKSSQEVVDLNQKNVSETNMVLEKLPAMLVELQKTKLIRNKI